eukprot:Clim_evm37s242 gene=Clim_evmTU37s242
MSQDVSLNTVGRPESQTDPRSYEDVPGVVRSGRVFKVCLTGGPCAGKTTVQSLLYETLTERGYKVYRLPEVATVLLGAGVSFASLSKEQANRFQEDLLHTMLKLEDTFENMANLEPQSTKGTVIICDRGAMDPSAYADPEEWDSMCKKNKWHETDLRDNRYDMVVYLVTAAKGAEAFYSTESNNVRSEGIELARELDTKVGRAWVGHPYLEIVDNSTTFDLKLKRVVAAVATRLGERDLQEIVGDAKARDVKYKFLLKAPQICYGGKKPSPFAVSNCGNNAVDNDLIYELEKEVGDDNLEVMSFDVVSDFISSSDGTQQRIRRRGRNGSYTFTHTTRYPHKDGQRVEVKRSISGREYVVLRNSMRRTDKHTVYKTRFCFMWAGRYWTIDRYEEPAPPRCKGLMLMEAYFPREASKQVVDESIPKFVDVVRDVTNEPEYSMYELAKVLSGDVDHMDFGRSSALSPSLRSAQPGPSSSDADTTGFVSEWTLKEADKFMPPAKDK